MQFEKYESDEDKVPSIFEIIGAICLLEEDLEPYLDIWQEKIINTDYRYFLDVVLEVFPHIQNKESLNPYLDRSRINENKLREWIKINIDKEGFKKYINLFPKGKMWRLDSIYYELIKFENS